MRYLKTSEAATLLNVSPNTLRAWERRFDFPKPQRSQGKHRLFTHGEIAALRDALQEGLSISSAVSRAREGLAADTNSLVGALVSYDRERADPAIEAALALRSVERSVEEVLLPTLDEIPAATVPNRPRGRSPRIGARTGCAARCGSRRRRSGRVDPDRRRLPRRAGPRQPLHPRAGAVLRARGDQRAQPVGPRRGRDRRRGRDPAARSGRCWPDRISTTTRSPAGHTRSGWRPARCRSPSTAAAIRPGPRAHDRRAQPARPAPARPSAGSSS